MKVFTKIFAVVSLCFFILNGYCKSVAVDDFSRSPLDDITLLSPVGTEEKKFGESLTISWQNYSTYATSDYFQLTTAKMELAG